MSLNTNALVNLATAKTLVGTAWSDAQLEAAINAASGLIERVCNRQFTAATHREWHKLRGRTVVVKNPPILRVDRIARWFSDAISCQYTGDSVAATVSIATTGVRLMSLAADGTETAETLTFALYPTLSTMVTAIAAVTDWTATKVASGDGESRDLAPMAGRDAKTSPMFLHWPEPSADEAVTSIDYNPGIIMFQYIRGSAKEFYRRVFVRYYGGYEDIQTAEDNNLADLRVVAVDVAKTILQRAALNTGGATSESLGDYSIALRTNADYMLDLHTQLSRWLLPLLGRQ